MINKPNFDLIKRLYDESYAKAKISNRIQLFLFEINWENSLNRIHLKIYHDIKTIGVWLYPYYPLGGFFLDFGNPFKKIGIEILYKDHGKKNKEKRLAYFKRMGWQIYLIESINTYYSAADTFEYYNSSKGKRFYQNTIQYDEWFKFINDFKELNVECLVHYIKEIHFKETNNQAEIEEY
jgi:hypothetical protein